ncbi:MAG TPA: type II toxin-antitoxin system VapC family toxin [Gaiellaceae bacterium]|nr:type II toxin-antitoxin system VapC family toxin [Gaiellaceae bacterium]
MKLPDANVLLYAVDEASAYHASARGWLEDRLSGSETIAFSWSVLLAFIRLSTSPRVFASPLSPDESLDLVDSWLAQPCAALVHPGGRHSALLRELLAPLGTAGNLTTDAHLAALAIEHGAELVSFDRDFQRFGGVHWSSPLTG